MAEENKTATPANTASAAAEKTADPAVAPIAEPTLADDFLKLEQINRLRAGVLRMQGGRHPDKNIDALLQRRLNISREQFQGPYAIRLVCTLMMVFVVSALAWAILWGIGSAMEMSDFVKLVSTGLMTLFGAISGVAIFYPSSIPEEKILIEAIEERMNQLRQELGKNETATDDRTAKPGEEISGSAAKAADNTAETVAKPDNNEATDYRP